MQVYSVYDKKMGTYMPPMYVEHLIQIQRTLLKNMQNPESLITQYPEDYSVYILGDWDPKLGEYNLKPKPEFVFDIQDLKGENKNDEA